MESLNGDSDSRYYGAPVENGHHNYQNGIHEYVNGTASHHESKNSYSVDEHFTRSLSYNGPQLRNRSFQPQIDKVYSIFQKDGTTATGEVLAVRQNSRTKVTEYFVHYEGQNRRLDEWISLDRFREDPVTPVAAAAAAPQTPAILKNEGNKALAPVSVVADSSTQKVTRSARRKFDEMNHIQPSLADLLPSQATLERLHEERTKVKYIDRIIFGRYDIDTWYFSPYPEEYGRREILYICEFCIKYMKHYHSYQNHVCPLKHPPGRQIYKKDNVSVYEVDGKEAKVYCQCLCLLAKLFLDHKTLYFDVESFMFYILTENDEDGCHVVGYFSKEKDSLEGNNLACIMTLPPYQRKGYGKFLIGFSYELSRRENAVGSPEKPLSDLGKLSYRSYWSWMLLEVLKDATSNLSIKELSQVTMFHENDIIDTLQSLNLCKYWKGHHVLCVNTKIVQECLLHAEFQKPKLLVDSKALMADWKPPPKPPRLTSRTLSLSEKAIPPEALPSPIADADVVMAEDLEDDQEAEPEPDPDQEPMECDREEMDEEDLLDDVEEGESSDIENVDTSDAEGEEEELDGEWDKESGSEE
ncbi:histone acetyltransferase KAT8-like [Paramacrobiotus metropolitanus]|uniref:histone acetyltransferase KAT8-like n=1 Tax=Paramacrobiotus metropolitanus TaxID=2943436 RepID=UPI00244585F4|nr:histone acetyltransferase KAT8-like [Paramacrobiotus metropolitanus]